MLLQVKICKSCKIEQNLNQFRTYKRKMANDKHQIYHRIYCKQCEAAFTRQWRLKNAEKVKLYNASQNAIQSKNKWVESNKAYRKQYQQQYYLKNIDKFKAVSQTVKFKQAKKEYKCIRKKIDPAFKIRCNISRSIVKALRKGSTNKAGRSILQHLEYTIIDLKKHLENQFNAKMSWENYGIYWHIDHIIPQSDLPYTSMKDDNFKICWSLKNLRPLEARQNLIDGARRIRHKKI